MAYILECWGPCEKKQNNFIINALICDAFAELIAARAINILLKCTLAHILQQRKKLRFLLGICETGGLLTQQLTQARVADGHCDTPCPVGAKSVC